ncbi:MAG: LysR family transcriptional regulator, partial [Oscillospiraceae bacterium]|nr:LysR family transcriptional regulator [Oscillospiraceae bacterium]
MEISQMRYFRAIVQYGSFSEAADHLHMTQPALSKSMAKLESELGAPLLERTGGRVTLTPAGRVFLPYCGEVLNNVESSAAAVRESIGLKQGHVAIAIATEVFIKHLIRDFLTQYPDVSLTCHLMSPEEMARALEDGAIDFALSGQQVFGEHITWKPLYSGFLTAVLSSGDPLLARGRISMGDLRHHQFCIGHVRSSLYSSIYELCAEAGFLPRLRYLGYD